jgi:hypothetical protein
MYMKVSILSIFTKNFCTNKKARKNAGFLAFGASGRTRTDTLLRAPDFESGASTNSATLAMWAAL